MSLCAGVTALGAVAIACGGGFDPVSAVDNVRMFAVQADKPYAKPGETVTLKVLLADARRVKPKPAKVYWLPLVCMNPTSDLYYVCFIAAAAGGIEGFDAGATVIPVGPLAGLAGDGGAEGGAPDGGAGADAGSLFSAVPPGFDLSPYLPQGESFSFQMPADAIQPRRPGVTPYGLAFVFNIACAGKVTLVQRDAAGGAQQVPIACVGDDGKPLSPNDYVIGISRVYSYADETNANPIIEKATLEGLDVDPAAGITIDRCTADLRANCAPHKIDIRVADASWELNPSETKPDEVIHEQIWVDYYADMGQVGSDARLLFDTRQGRISGSDVKYYAPNDPQEGTLWAVVHDNRGGAAWMTIPLHVK